MFRRVAQESPEGIRCELKERRAESLCLASGHISTLEAVLGALRAVKTLGNPVPVFDRLW